MAQLQDLEQEHGLEAEVRAKDTQRPRTKAKHDLPRVDPGEKMHPS